MVAGIALAGAAPDFAKEVAPILEAHCLSCHDATHHKGDFILETRAAALSHESAIMPGDPLASELLASVSGPEPEMPKKAKPLSAAEVEILRSWIAAGAAWPEGRVLAENRPRDLDWWSLRSIPKVDGAPKAVDHFIEAKLAEAKLSPAPEADPVTLIRRLTYDLTGLPPTPEEVDAFVRDARDNLAKAVAKHADRLLASPAFGEAWARHWLDVARYAETHGYDKDKPRMNAWPYRDYVIRSLNSDKPFSKFVQEQIAGDVLYPGTEDGITALGFIAAGPWDLIGHIEVGEGKLDGRIAKHLDRDEMVSTVFNVFQSTTVQCAQCHHHKFDPIKMEDYYSLQAVFAAVDRADRVYAGLDPGQEKTRNDLQAQVNALKAEQSKLQTEAKRALGARTSGIERRLAELRTKYGSPLRPRYGYHSAISAKQDVEKWVQVDLGAPMGVEQVRLIPAYDTFNGIGAGFGFPVRYRVEVSTEPDFKEPRLVRDATSADQPNPRNGEIAIDVGGAGVRYIRVTATKLAPRQNDYIFALGELQAIGGENHDNRAPGTKVTALDSIEAAPRWGRANLTDGNFYREVADPAALAEFTKLEAEKAAIEAELRDPARETRLAELDKALAGITPKLAALPQGKMVYAAATRFAAQGGFRATDGIPREIRLLQRGDIKAPAGVMTPGAPPLWPAAPVEFPGDKEAQARAALAQYLTAPENPLLWRSVVNRIWQWTFGVGLVTSPNDFGRMGMKPTHPELLDQLAAQLRDDPQQSLKSIIRTLVTSEAYRRASQDDPANARIDANNTLLWRANRRRLTAEEYRDSLLAVSGVLRASDPGGPSFQDFVIEKPQHSPHYEYGLYDVLDPSTYRRSIYRFIVRSQPQPFLTVLDCADPSQSVAQRDESTTALQALAQWNNRLVEAMARKFADRIGKTPGAPVETACQLALGRPPTAEEHAALEEHLKQHGSASLCRVVFNLNAFVYLD